MLSHEVISWFSTLLFSLTLRWHIILNATRARKLACQKMLPSAQSHVRKFCVAKRILIRPGKKFYSWIPSVYCWILFSPFGDVILKPQVSYSAPNHSLPKSLRKSYLYRVFPQIVQQRSRLVDDMLSLILVVYITNLSKQLLGLIFAIGSLSWLQIRKHSA